jgi:cyanophycin synthetase
MFLKLPGKTNTFGTYIKTALENGIKVKILDRKNRLAKLSYKNKKILLFDMLLPLNSVLATFLARQKFLTKSLLQKKSIPTSFGFQTSSFKAIPKKMFCLDYPLVVKPVVGGRGVGITTNIISKEELKKAIQKALAFNDQVLVERYFQGYDFRFLILDSQVIASVLRKIPSVTGTGKNTIETLIKNKNKKRIAFNKKNHEIILRKIRINDELNEMMQKQGFNLRSIPPKGKKVFLSMVANWSKGGTVKTVKTAFFHPSILKTAVKAVEALQLKFAAVDFLIKNPQEPFDQKNGVVLEINSYPGINIFHYPAFGRPQNVASQILTKCFALN